MVTRAWTLRAACLDMPDAVFYPERGEDIRRAKRICRTCPVIVECLEYAVAHNERFGVWGGLSERERRRLRREAS